MEDLALEKTIDKLFNRKDLAERWGTSVRTIDRKRQDGLIRWIDLAGGRGRRPLVRFKLSDIEAYEEQMAQFPSISGGDRGVKRVN